HRGVRDGDREPQVLGTLQDDVVGGAVGLGGHGHARLHETGEMRPRGAVSLLRRLTRQTSLRSECWPRPWQGASFNFPLSRLRGGGSYAYACFRRKRLARGGRSSSRGLNSFHRGPSWFGHASFSFSPPASSRRRGSLSPRRPTRRI